MMLMSVMGMKARYRIPPFSPLALFSSRFSAVLVQMAHCEKELLLSRRRSVDMYNMFFIYCLLAKVVHCVGMEGGCCIDFVYEELR